MSTTPELSRIKSVRVPRRMYVSKFQRYGGAAIVVVLAVAVGAGILPKADRQERLEEKRRLERETWCDVGDARLDRGLPGPGAPPIKFDRCTTVDLTMRSEPLGNEGARLLSQALVGKRYGKEHRRNVRRLLLQHQDISDGGARSIARILAECADGHLTCAFVRGSASVDFSARWCPTDRFPRRTCGAACRSISRTTRSRIAASSRCARASSARGAAASPSWSGSAAGSRARRGAGDLS